MQEINKRKKHKSFINLRKKRNIDFRMYNNPYSVKETYPEVEKVDEENLKVIEQYCDVLECGRKLGLREKLFGNRCIHHQISKILVLSAVKINSLPHRKPIFDVLIQETLNTVF